MNGRGRGPDPAEFALDVFKRELLEFRRLGNQLLRKADDLLAARAKLVQEAGIEVRIDAERELYAVLQMRDGVPFWDRTAPEPRSLKAVAE